LEEGWEEKVKREAFVESTGKGKKDIERRNWNK
jgi:hypothetical protein